ncbi:MAG: hypothetical protein DSM106950_40930 [Stigonema ocellatum SAG 48.90 = DSM 106950]|nr:hypothetical protein [Stigonema ocellatum SAG 48.90 = DSM 106950]
MTYTTDRWGIAIQYFEMDKHLPILDFIDPWTDCYGTNQYDEINLQRQFEYRLNKEYFDPVVYSRDNKERVEGLIVGGQRIKRLPDNEHLFTAIEETINPYPYDSSVGFIREIWRFNILVCWRGIKTYTKEPDGKVTVKKLVLNK